ncbi:MAG TPA: hypothetical protein VHI78_01980 [Bacteroidales bacterium]|jgi:hypothetical protein|nr:hypothetical protein [Bacteroidales bacterium]
MEPEKSKSPIPKMTPLSPANGKSETVDDDKASLVKSGKLPFLMQRKVVASDEEEKEKWLLKQKAIQMQKVSSLLFNESEKKK